MNENLTKLDECTLNKLSCIIPLKQLTKLDLKCKEMPQKQVVQLLSLASNIQTLLFDFEWSQEDLCSMKENELFQSVSNQNHVTKLILSDECTLSKIQLCFALFPFVKYLTVNVVEDDLESIVRFLLSKDNENTQFLSLVCLKTSEREKFVNVLNILSQSKDL